MSLLAMEKRPVGTFQAGYGRNTRGRDARAASRVRVGRGRERAPAGAHPRGASNAVWHPLARWALAVVGGQFSGTCLSFVNSSVAHTIVGCNTRTNAVRWW